MDPGSAAQAVEVSAYPRQVSTNSENRGALDPVDSRDPPGPPHPGKAPRARSATLARAGRAAPPAAWTARPLVTVLRYFARSTGSSSRDRSPSSIARAKRSAKRASPAARLEVRKSTMRWSVVGAESPPWMERQPGGLVGSVIARTLLR